MAWRILAAFPLALAGAAWFEFLALPWPVALRWRNPERTALMEYRIREAAARGERFEIRHQWVPLERISRHLRRAVLVAEDARFYEHRGIDWASLREELRYRGDASFSWRDPDDLRALLGALRYWRAHRDEVRGRSTITQQLAKNLYFTPERSLLRKLEEFVVARRLERFLSKDRILELYLNVAEWGPGIFGAEAAARAYFGRSAARLTPEQAAALAATLPHPLTSNPRTRPGRMAWRQRLILARMGARGPVETVPLEPPGAPVPDRARPPADTPAPAPPPAADTAAVPPSARGTAPARDTVATPPDTAPARPDTAAAPPHAPAALIPAR